MKAVQVAIETEDAAKVAKETVYSAKGKSIHKIQKGLLTGSSKVNNDSSKKIKCYRCVFRVYASLGTTWKTIADRTCMP